MKKLEPGCRAMIVKCINYPEVVGLFVRVGNFIGNHDFYMGNDIYMTFPAWETSFYHEITGSNIWAEHCLMRIDDDANLENKESLREKSWSQ